MNKPIYEKKINKKIFIYISLLVLLLVIGAGLGTYFGKFYKNKPSKSPSNTNNYIYCPLKGYQLVSNNQFGNLKSATINLPTGKDLEDIIGITGDTKGNIFFPNYTEDGLNGDKYGIDYINNNKPYTSFDNSNYTQNVYAGGFAESSLIYEVLSSGIPFKASTSNPEIIEKNYLYLASLSDSETNSNLVFLFISHESSLSEKDAPKNKNGLLPCFYSDYKYKNDDLGNFSVKFA